MVPFLKNFFPEVYKKMEGGANTSNYCKFSSQLLTSFTSSLYLAGLVASCFASSGTRSYDRKSSMLALESDLLTRCRMMIPGLLQAGRKEKLFCCIHSLSNRSCLD